MSYSPARILVMVSGGGTNLQALIDAVDDGRLECTLAGVISSDAEAFALERAKKAHLPFAALPYRRDRSKPPAESRADYDGRLADLASAFKPDWIFLLGWMRLLSNTFIARFPGKIVNLHPALPGSFPGTHAIERAWDAFLAGSIRESGAMTHYVDDERVDAGPIIAMETVPFLEADSLEDFEERMHGAEHGLVVRTARILLENQLPRRG